MSVEQIDKIDFVGRSDDGKQLRLAISDHLDWSDEKGHLHTLQEKVNSYVAFIESGQIAEHHGEEKPSSVAIRIYFLHEPTKLANEFLEHTKQVLAGISVTLESQVVDKSTLDSMAE